MKKSSCEGRLDPRHTNFFSTFAPKGTSVVSRRMGFEDYSAPCPYSIQKAANAGVIGCFGSFISAKLIEKICLLDLPAKNGRDLYMKY